MEGSAAPAGGRSRRQRFSVAEEDDGGRQERIRSERTNTARVVLLAGPSGSGKSRVARLAGRPQLALDDFYRDLDHPGLPRARGIVDWDDVVSWDADAAFAVVDQLCRTGRADVPRYDIATSRRVGTVQLDLAGAECFVAEGLFAPDLVARCGDAGLRCDALYLSRPRTLSLILRFARDVREHRKPIPILLRRGLALWRSEPRLRAYALSRGCRPVTLRKALAIIGGGDRIEP